MQKQRNIQYSIMNDVNLKEYAALMVSEPHMLEMDKEVDNEPDETPRLDGYTA